MSETHRYIPEADHEKIEKAFQLWMTEAKGSCQQVANIMNTPVRAIYLWQAKYDWKGKRRELQAEMGEDALQQGKTELRLAVSTAVQRLVTMIENDDTKDSEQRENIRLLFAYVFDQDIHAPSTLIDARQVHIQPGNLQADPLTRATRILEANVSHQQTDSRRGKRKTF